MQLNDFRTLGPTGLRVSPICLGTMTFGDAGWGADDATSAAILDRYLDAGGNFLDSADKYNEGRSEEVLGAYLTARPGARERVVLATKFGASMNPTDPNAGGASRKAIIHALDRSLARLGTDYIDLYWLHNWDPHTPLEETIATFDDIVRAGKVRYVGLSNVPAWWVARAATTAELRGYVARIAALQIEYSLLERTVEGEQLGVAREFGLGVLPWSPLASGVLSGKYSRKQRAPIGSGRSRFAAPRLNDATFVLLDALADIASEVGTTVAGVALAWVRQQPAVSSTLVGARTVAQLDANLASLQVTLDVDQLATLDALTAPALEAPLPFLRSLGPGWAQGDTTVNGVSATAFSVL